MARSLRIATLVLVLLAVAWCSSPAAADAGLAPAEPRLLREQLKQSETAMTAESSSSSSSSLDADVNATASANTESSSATAIETTHEGPSAMSFFGPAIAGVLAIVLIGAVVTFKNRMGK